MTKKDNTPAKKRKAERKKMERESASTAAEATAAAADAFNRTVAEAFVSDNNSRDNAPDKDGTKKVPTPEPGEEASSSGKPESTSEATEPTRISKLTTENTDLKNQLAALKQGMYVEHVDRVYGSGKQAQHLREHVSPGTTEALHKWTERRLVITPEKRKDLSTKPVAVDSDVLSVSIPYKELPPEVQDLYLPELSPGHESPIIEGIIDPEAGKNTAPPLPNWDDNRWKPIKTGYVIQTHESPKIIIPKTIQGTEHRRASTMDFTRGSRTPRTRINEVEFNRFDRTALHQPAEDFHSDEVTELNKSVNDYTRKMEIAHEEHRGEDVSYYANMIAIKQKRIDQLLQAQRGQDHRNNHKYKGLISLLKSNWDANSKQVEFINNHDHDHDTLTRLCWRRTISLPSSGSLH
ncbi:hypothetical protein SARC_01486 [Sphaeroforma arctica JP610]|uniref:Uncharacterized protein n=1 Tax=Sphaeroforma arctica JP610 TaxID=667725 RepID=A0A0L0GBX1_9EUKA|nr:hypothetical protein SARC_01486 [Sphaeroforma arctica JP610]KNC86391.1 hypothetical protein SARC_01486 [Sphaeroforma arctica JP610]|eukprot:XP_014160293.1 hypothetical protein SARC_01486 [Sphaeroforma arctica JP610]